MSGQSPASNEQPLAAIDIGTNTIRLLVATPVVSDGVVQLRPLQSRTATVRLGYGVEQSGSIAPERLTRAVTTVEEFRQVAAQYGATTVLVAATSAVRDAANGAELRERIAATSGLDVQIVAGLREAALTFAGATAGESLAGTLLVADLGGGSLELIVARDGAISKAESLQIGSGRLAERHITTDPPDQAAIAAVEADAQAALAAFARDVAAVGRGIVVGGTATSLLVLVPRPAETRTLTHRRLTAAAALLTGAPAAALAAETGLDLERVRTLPAGVGIIRALLQVFDLPAAGIGSGGIREGLLLEHLRGSGQLAARSR
jgi:exopolyphosphatase / guanosine-5'-triphosphate,3'-diphosphate pyrophosphatase